MNILSHVLVHQYGDRRLPVPGVLSIIAAALAAVTAAIAGQAAAAATAGAAVAVLAVWLIIYLRISAPINRTLTAAAEAGFNPGKILARGISTGGYYAFRIAHTHADRLFAVVAQGGGCHHMFDAGWINHQNQVEYPFALSDALAYKFGYRDPDPAAVARYAAEARRFSLADSGVLGTPTCRLLVVNGMDDSIFPIEDSIVAATQGGGKDLVARGDRRHMGNPGAEEILYEWLDKAVDGKP
jgi:hypothetical protein